MVRNEINDPVRELEECIQFLRTPRKERKKLKKEKQSEVKKKSTTKQKKTYKSFMKVASIVFVISCCFLVLSILVRVPNFEQFIVSILESFSIEWGADAAKPTNFTKYNF